MLILDPPVPRIYESWKPYEDFFMIDSRGWTVPDIGKIEGLKLSYDFVLANCSTEHWGSERHFPLTARLHDLLSDHFAKDFVCLCHDPADEKLRSGVLYFPYWAWYRSWISVSPAQISNNHRTYLYSNLNYHARDFRIAVYLGLKQKPWADRCLITMHDMRQENHDYDNYMLLTEEEMDSWQKQRSGLSRKISDGFGNLFDCTHPAFADTYLHIISESTIKDKIFLTEKTWKAVLSGQLFVVWGNSGIVSHLRNHGVDVFDDIVDHDYDTVPDARTRLMLIYQELDRLSQMDWSHIYERTEKRRASNSVGFVKGAFIEKSVLKMVSKLPKQARHDLSRRIAHDTNF